MKIAALFFVLLFFISSCTTTKKAPVKAEPTVTKADLLNGGTSFSNPVVLRVTSEREGKDEEYKWLKNLYPGYSLVKRSEAKRPPKYYDVIRIKTKEGQLKDIYFDTTSFAARK
jgi:hypothetical protein